MDQLYRTFAGRSRRRCRLAVICQHVDVIVVAGEALVDLVIGPDGEVTAALGGAPFNVARAAARLGGDVEFVGALSDDRFGRSLAARLNADGVGLRFAPRTTLPTTLAAAELDAAGSASYRFYLRDTSAPDLRPGSLGALPTDPSFVVTGGLAFVLEPMAGTITGLLDRLAPSTMVVVDVNCRPAVIADRAAYLDTLRRALARADVVKVSDEDLDALAPELDIDDLLTGATEAVFVTSGSAGTTVCTRSTRVEVPVATLADRVVDTIGAGDTFVGAFVAWWSAAGFGRTELGGDGAPDRLAQSVRAAHAAAAVVVTRRGADPPHLHDLPTTWPPQPACGER